MYREGFPYLGEEFAVTARLPGTGQRWFWHGAVLVGYVCLATLAIVLGPAEARGLAGAVAAAAPVVLFPARRLAGRFQAWMLHQPGWGLEAVEAPGLGAALVPAGLRRVTVVTAPAGHRVMRRHDAWSSRSGRAGVIVLPADLKDPEAVNPDVTRVVTAHEAAHLARDDSMTGDLLSVGRLCLLLVVALTAPASLWLLLPLVAVPAAVRWRMELVCDRMAAEAAGPAPARTYVDHHSEMLERARGLPLPRRLIWRLRSTFTHPPWRMRRNAVTSVIAKQEQASPPASLSRWTGSAGDAAAARDQYAARLPIRERALGPGHPDTLTMRHELARSTGDAGDAAAARDQFTALLPVRERALGPDHPHTSATRLNLAYWTWQAGDASRGGYIRDSGEGGASRPTEGDGQG